MLWGGGARARNRDTSLSKNYRRPSRLVPGGTRFAVPYGPRTECNGRRLTSAAACMIVATSSSGKYERLMNPTASFPKTAPTPPGPKARARGCQASRRRGRATSAHTTQQKKRLLHLEWSSVTERPRFQRSQRSKMTGWGYLVAHQRGAAPPGTDPGPHRLSARPAAAKRQRVVRLCVCGRAKSKPE